MNEQEVAWLASLKETHQAAVNENVRLTQDLAALAADQRATGDVLAGILGKDRCPDGNVCHANDVALRIELAKLSVKDRDYDQNGQVGKHKIDWSKLEKVEFTEHPCCYGMAVAGNQHSHDCAVFERDRLREQVTSLQTRCTELLEERRRAHVDYAVREFHLKFDQPAPGVLGIPSDDVVRFRGRLVTEEYLELLDAMFGDCRERPWWFKDIAERLYWFLETAPVEVDLVEWADATHDLDYVVAGTRVAFGYNGLPGAAEVHRSNMAKGSNDENGKPTKPEGWTPPDLERVLREQGWRKP
jgi:predicted HAD superfamily Cof-like phosphohydrolase